MVAVTADITAWGNTVHSMASPLAKELVRVTKRGLASGCDFSLQELRKAGLAEQKQWDEEFHFSMKCPFRIAKF